jgi:hypothetical protein
MSTKRMGGMGKLSDFGTTAPAAATPVPMPPVPQTEPKKQVKKSAPKQERLVTVNIKVNESQQEWLADTAKQVRRNNDEPVAAIDRVYPQHLIGIAIDLLKDSDVDWDKIQNIQDLKKTLDL